jgi:hypothetical protein
MEVCGPIGAEELWPATDRSCSSPYCGEPINYGEDIFMITMYTTGLAEQGLVYSPIPAEDGDYLYEPCYFCKECWEYVIDELREITSDMPPIADDQSSFTCHICESGIRTGELFGIAVFGQLQFSERCPDAAATATFKSIDTKPLMLCIGCMNLIEKDIAEMWGGRITEHNECAEGTFMRCWRHGCAADGNCSHNIPEETGE